MKEISLETHSRVEMIDITAAVQKAIQRGKDRRRNLSCLHAAYNRRDYNK